MVAIFYGNKYVTAFSLVYVSNRYPHNTFKLS